MPRRWTTSVRQPPHTASTPPRGSGRPRPAPGVEPSREDSWSAHRIPLAGRRLPSPSVSARFGPIDFDRFHTVELPERLAAGNGKLAAAHLERCRPIAFRLDDGSAYTYTPTPDGIDVKPGEDDAQTVVELTHADWCDFVWELKTCFALLYAERIAVSVGSFGQLSRWEPALRAAFDGQPVYDFSSPPPVVDIDGNPLDLTTTFTLDDSDEEIVDFLRRTGFIHVRGVFSPDEVETLRSEVEAAVAKATPDDQRSWWTTVDGADVCNRVNYLNEQS